MREHDEGVTCRVPRVFVIAGEGESAFDQLRTSPYVHMLSQLSQLGEITPHLLRPVPQDVLIAFEPTPEVVRFAASMRAGLRRKHMIVREPKMVRPDLYRKSLRRHFDCVWAPSPMWAHDLEGETYATPLHIPDVRADIERSGWELRSSVPVLLLANKYSAIDGEMYWLRRALMKESGRRGLPIDVIGHGWDMARFTRIRKMTKASLTAMQSGLAPHVKLADLSASGGFPDTVRVIGSVNDKYSTLAKYQVAFVPENSRDWVSEKLFDAVVAGCIPIYVGGNLSDFGFPAGMCLTPEPTAEALWDAAEEVSGWSWSRRKECLEIGQEFVHSAAFVEKWRNDHSLKSLGSRIVSFVGTRSD